MTWLLVFEVIYIAILILVCLRITYDTRSHTKTLAYLLLVIFLPLAGIIFYFPLALFIEKEACTVRSFLQMEFWQRNSDR